MLLCVCAAAPVQYVRYAIRYDTIDDLHWKTDRQAPGST